MRINADFSQPAVVRPGEQDWVASPMAGVERQLLDRIGDEVARATSFVRYAPNSKFPPHSHGGGEEIFVLDGEFADEHATYPAGFYLRNPVGTSHTPSVGPAGALIFVKLRQFESDDQRQCVIDTRSSGWLPGTKAGLSVMPLHEFRGEQVRLMRLAPGVSLDARGFAGGEELVVLDGEFSDGEASYPTGSWVRWPAHCQKMITSGDAGALLFSKLGHLPEAGE